MRVIALLLVATIVLTSSADAQGQESLFCDGFDEGWKVVRGELAITPICPIEPITPIGSTPYREGLKVGMAAGRKSGGGNSGGASYGPRSDDGDDFCAGFEVGWKAVKRDLSIVPICPIPPITPIGSTPYREEIKAGMAKARS